MNTVKGTGLLMDWCLFISIKNKFCKRRPDIKVDVLICHFQWKASFLLGAHKAPDDWGSGQQLPAPVIYVRMC